KDINEKRKAADKLTGDKRKKELDRLADQEAIARKAMTTLEATGGHITTSLPTTPTMPSIDHHYTDVGLAPPGTKVGEAARASAARKPGATTGTGTHTSSTATTTGTTSDLPRVDLHVTAICEHCKQKLETKQLTGTSVAAGTHS